MLRPGIFFVRVYSEIHKHQRIFADCPIQYLTLCSVLEEVNMSEKINIPDIIEKLQNPRRAGGKMMRPLPGLIILAIIVFACGAYGWTKIEDFGESQLKWLRQY